ncbi:MAG TPA: ECF-type sigma factor [Gemmataceae bacterium]|nr:ECF-type sigma factor [Gemmataceae bacterium]
MSSRGSVTHWINLLKGGDRVAVQPLWERYFRLLVSRARAALGAAPRRAADEEDVALSAFGSFCKGVEKGRFPRLDDRNDLWRILLSLTARKAAHQKRDESRLKRGGGAVRPETDLPDAADGDGVLAQAMGAEPTPQFAAEVAEESRRLFDKLGDDVLRSIAQRKLEGYTAEEIAEQLGCAPRTVNRKLAEIRDLWRAEGWSP